MALLIALVASTAWAQQQPAPPRPKPGAPPRELTPQELDVLKEVERDADRYAGAVGDHVEQMRGILRREYQDKVRAAAERYHKAMDGAEKDYRARHMSALEALQKFLVKYPDDPKWTPDAMFRLADLYLDKAKWEWDEKEAASADTPPPPVDPEAPPQYAGPDYTPSLDIWRQINERFPKYRQVDGAIYLYAYYRGEMRQTPESRQAFLGLVCRNKFDPLGTPPPPPDPRELRRRLAAGARPQTVDPYQGCEPMTQNQDLIDEGWIRVGEIDFDTPGSLPTAIAAYKRVAHNTKSKFYDIALYKLAWSYYRNNQFMDGIQAFDELVAYSDKLEDQGQPKNDLRGESVQYLAISFTDPWEENTLSDPVKAMERLNAFYKGRTNERHVRDVYEQVGDVLRLSAGTPPGGEVPPEIRTAYREAINAWRFTLDHYPTHPRNPVVHQKIVDALAFMGDAQAAGDERARLATAYKRGTPWYTANETNREAMDNASRLTEGSLIEAARNQHRSAQLAKQQYQKAPTPDGKRGYLRLYAEAANLYQAYLQEFPNSSDAYEVTYRLADCLYFSEQYVASVERYRWVRDHQELGTKYHDDAADSVVKAYEEAVAQAKAQGALKEPPVPTPETFAKGARSLSVPSLYRDLQGAYDEYAKLVPNDSTASQKALAAAMISYRHVQLDDALARFQGIMTTYCKTSEAVQAKEGMLAIYQGRGQTDKFQATADKFIGDKCGSTPQDVLVAQKQKLSNEYTVAINAYKDGRFDEAGQRFYGLYKAGTDVFADRAGAMFNAALAYTKAGKPKTAVALYQEFVKVPEFAKSEYYIEALYRTAESYQAAFDYEAAVDTYLQVVDEAAKPGRTSRPEFNLEEARVNALYNAALLRDLDRVYYDRGKNDPGAATLYKRYAAFDQKNRERARDAFFNAALVYEKAGNTKDMIATFDQWKRQYGKDAGAGFKLVLAQHKTAKAMEKARDKDAADKYYKATIRAYDESGEKPASPASELAGEAQFWLAEQYYKKEFEKYKVRWLGNIADKNQTRASAAVVKTIDELQKVAKATSAGYEAVARFEASWSLAAIVRLGDIAFFAGQKLLDAPVPAEITRLDKQYPEQNVLGSYQESLEQQVAPNTELAKKQWLRAVETAKKAGVANEWSKLAQQRLNSYIAADQYPVQRDELVDKEQNP
ncbi:MAG TPA: tetratricopeptide repeat protein [Haliangiales bacterium]|nr:tetratricopeptide repeat protein [Haliangiales bacterium]